MDKSFRSPVVLWIATESDYASLLPDLVNSAVLDIGWTRNGTIAANSGFLGRIYQSMGKDCGMLIGLHLCQHLGIL